MGEMLRTMWSTLLEKLVMWLNLLLFAVLSLAPLLFLFIVGLALFDAQAFGGLLTVGVGCCSVALPIWRYFKREVHNARFLQAVFRMHLVIAACLLFAAGCGMIAVGGASTVCFGSGRLSRDAASMASVNTGDIEVVFNAKKYGATLITADGGSRHLLRVTSLRLKQVVQAASAASS